MQVDPHHIADAATAVAVTRNHQPQRMSIHRLSVPTIGQEHLLTLEVRIDLGKRQHGSIAIASGDEDGAAQASPWIATQHLSAFEHGPEQRTRIGRLLRAAAVRNETFCSLAGNCSTVAGSIVCACSSDCVMTMF